MTTTDPIADLAQLARSLRLVADQHRKQGETTFTVRRIDQMVDTVEGAEATIANLEHRLQQADELATAAYRDADAAEAKLAAIDALHRSVVQYPDMDNPLVPFVACEHCGEAHPCPTHLILHPPVSAPETLPITHDEGTPDGPR